MALLTANNHDRTFILGVTTSWFDTSSMLLWKVLRKQRIVDCKDLAWFDRGGYCQLSI